MTKDIKNWIDYTHTADTLIMQATLENTGGSNLTMAQ